MILLGMVDSSRHVTSPINPTKAEKFTGDITVLLSLAKNTLTREKVISRIIASLIGIAKSDIPVA